MCGLKLSQLRVRSECGVTPLAGVRIETDTFGYQRPHADVTPLAGVRIETHGMVSISISEPSHLSQVCGLKLLGSYVSLYRPQSHLSQVCGLKPVELYKDDMDEEVTPLAGVRIETSSGIGVHRYQ